MDRRQLAKLPINKEAITKVILYSTSSPSPPYDFSDHHWSLFVDTVEVVEALDVIVGNGLVVKRKELEQINVKNSYPLPRIDDLFDQLRVSVSFLKDIFSVRLSSAYECMWMPFKDRISNDGYEHFESTVMPFGLTNAPTVFMDLMNWVCKPYLGRMFYGQRLERESSLIGPDLVLEMTDKVVLVSPWKEVMRFGKKGKLAPRYVGSFKILERIGMVAYRLRLPEELSSVHDTFHVSNLKKCLAGAIFHVPLNEIKVDKTIRFVKEPLEIMDREIKKLKGRNIALVKVRWNSKRGP
ncbi:hypothetical protein Tco_0186351 [Tanacetum coccineum]